MKTQRSRRGFTLLELMIVVVAIGILASIAYPSYTQAVRKAKRAQARAALVELLQQQERYMTQHNCYLAFTTNDQATASATAPYPGTACGGITATSVPFKTYAGESVASASHLLSARNCTGADGSSKLSIAYCVEVVARPLYPDPEAGNLEMTSSGTKHCTGTEQTTQPRLCWP